MRNLKVKSYKLKVRIENERGYRTIPFILFIALVVINLFLITGHSHAITITGTETITTNSRSQYTATNCNGTISWNVIGTGASISSNGFLTTGSASCGGITVTARCSDGTTATTTARVTNAGQWVLLSDEWRSECINDGRSCGCYNGALSVITEIRGKNKYTEVWASHCKWTTTPGNSCPQTQQCFTTTYTTPPSPSCSLQYFGSCVNSSLFGMFVYHQMIYEWQCPACTNGQTVSCYSGTEETKNKGECKAGTQTCVNGQWGACTGEVLPSAEICGNNADENCDGNKDEGCAVCEVSVKVVPAEVWPLIPKAQRPVGYKEDWTKADVVVILNKPAPPEGCNVNLKVEPVENSGGHSHNGSRPKGTIDKSVITIPSGAIGAESTTYKSSEFGGEEKIIAEVKGEKKDEVTIIVRVPNLYPMPSGNWRLTGQLPVHPINHYGTYYTIVNTHSMADDFYEQFDATLGINDMSLKWAVVLIYMAWLDDITSPQCRQKGHGHCSHRKGTGVDIDRCALSTMQDNPNPKGNCSNGLIQVDRIVIGESCKEHGGYLVREATIHCEFPYVE